MIELGRKYRTRDGREVRIYAIEPDGLYPVHGAIRSINGYWCARMWNHKGKMHGRRPNGQLIEVLPEVTVRQYLRKNQHLVGMADHENNPMWETIGAIDITHNGKEIIDVKVVK